MTLRKKVVVTFFFLLTYVTMAVSPACASLLLGQSGSNVNDNAANVLSVINAFNAANDPAVSGIPDQPTTFMELFKTEDDPDNFSSKPTSLRFFEDAAGTIEILSFGGSGGLHDRSLAYFEFDESTIAPNELLYYSVKGGNQGFNLYAFWPGMLNIMQTPTGQDISHATFWKGDRPNVIPEPTSLLTWGLGLVLAARVRRGAKRCLVS